MDLFSQFITLPNLILCLVIGILVEVQKRIAVKFFPLLTDKTSKWYKYWNELFLVIGPLGTGAIIGAFATMYPWPEIFAASLFGRISLGIVAGAFSGIIFRLFKKNILESLKKKESSSDSIPPQ